MATFSREVIAQTKFEFSAPGVYPEGVAYDARSNVFYVSGARTATIGKVTMGGANSKFYDDSTLKSTYGMKIDVAHNKLWVCAGDANYSKFQTPVTHKKMIRLIGRIGLSPARTTRY